ncbi:MAG: DNA polymerase [bacterium]|nr:DNA polymerase [bacterium]
MSLNSKKPRTQNSKRKRLVLLDAHAIIHRAYHALPDFSSSKGEPTGALYGLITMLRKITEDLKPDYIAACFDLPDPTHRHKVYEAYKATRAKTEDALVAQLIRARDVFKAFGIPQYEAKGFEADDLLGTIVKKLSASARKNIDIVIASGDHDTLQLVNDKRVQVYTLRKGLNDTVMYDEEKVKERFGFAPEYIADYKGLSGDASDNIKGIAGIGAKTATQLIAEFGSVEDIYAKLRKHPEEFAKRGVKPRVVKLLHDGEKDAAFSKMLATIRTDAPIAFEVPEKEWNIEEHLEDILSLCDELEFNSLKARFRYVLNPPDAPAGLPAEAGAQAGAESTVDKDALEETAIALWLLHSDKDPQLDEILRYAQTDLPAGALAQAGGFDSARTTIFEELKKTGRLQEVYDRIERPLIPIMRRMNEDGVFLDSAYLKKLAAEYTQELGKIEERIFKAAGHEFNISSPKQLANVLFDELKITPEKQKKTPGGARTTREDELAKMEDLHPVIADILAYRELSKLLSTYIEKMPGMVAADGRLHAEFLQAGTTTGRLSSKNPNLQNIPIKSDYGRRVREAFRAPPGRSLVALDYSQVELRVAAGLSGDKKLLKVFQEGGDVHNTVASQVFGVPETEVDYEMRRRAKVINFGILYGMGVNALKANLGNVSREEAAQFLSNYFKSFSGLALWIERTKLDAARRGFTETLFGRRRYFSGFKSPLPNLRAQADRMAVNAPIQGTQADIIKLAMVKADEMIEKNSLRDSVRLVLQIHDELVYEVAEKDAEKIAGELRKTMETVVPKGQLSDVPIVAEISIGENWGALKRV